VVHDFERSTRRRMPGGRVEAAELERGPNGRALCRWCRLEVPAGRRTFCSDFCVHEWRLRSDPGYLREKVLARDRGICALCGLDCVAEFNHIRRLRGGKRRLALDQWKARNRSSLWDVDHILPVAQGGGECDLDNLRTLCLRCHRAVTAASRGKLK
jgi:5-methylcytosine-specific restriction endonuclease McrA